MAIEFRVNNTLHQLRWIRLTTSRQCNMEKPCLHCSQMVSPQGPIMPIALVDLLTRHIPSGIDEVYVAGGEVFMNTPHLTETIQLLAARRKNILSEGVAGFKIVLETNGFWLLRPSWREIVRGLGKAGLKNDDRVDVCSLTPMHAEAGLDAKAIEAILPELRVQAPFRVGVWETTNIYPFGRAIENYSLFSSPESAYPPIRKDCIGLYGNKNIDHVIVDFEGRLNFCNEEAILPFGDVFKGNIVEQIKDASREEPFSSILSGDVDRLVNLAINKKIDPEIARALLEQGRYCEFCALVFRNLSADLIEIGKSPDRN